MKIAMALALGSAVIGGPSHDEVAADVPVESTSGQALVSAVRLGNAGYGGVLGWRWGLEGGLTVGVEVEAAYLPEAFIGGLAVQDDLGVGLRVPALFSLFRSRAVELALTGALGARYLRSFEAAVVEDQSVSVTVDVGVAVFVHQRDWSWMLGLDQALSFQLTPISDLNMQGTLLTTGPVVPLAEDLQWYATVEAGGVFGSDGDAGKFLVRGTTGLRFVFGPSARDWRAFY